MSAALSVAPVVGLHTRVPFATYLDMDGVNMSTLKSMGRSPLHYQHGLVTSKTTKAMTLGTTTHTAVLEPERFLVDYALWDKRTEGGDIRPRRGKEWDAFVEANAGKRIVLPDEYNAAQAIAKAVRSNPIAMRYLASGEPEVSMQWLTGDTLCKGRVDWLNTTLRTDTLVGLKTARDAGPIAFGNQACKLGYVESWAFYHDGYESLTNRTPAVVEIVVESAPPYDVVVYRVPPEVIDLGRDHFHSWLKRLEECKATGHWPGIAEDRETEVSLPAWAFVQDEDLSDLDLEGLT